MRFAVLALILSSSLWSANADKPRVNRLAVAKAAERVDRTLETMLPAEDPVSPVGLTQGAYIPGIGVVFMSTLNLAPMAGITPFHPTVTKDELVRIHKKKLERLPKLKQVVQQMLVNLAASLDTVPSDEQITIAVSLFNFSAEDVSGVPGQIVMHAQKKALLTGQSMLASSVQVEEF